MKNKALKITYLVTLSLLFLSKTTKAQSGSMYCGNYNPQNMEVALPYYNDTVNVYLLYDKNGKFTYNDQDHKDGKNITYQKIANKNFKKLESHNDIIIPVSFDNLQIFEEVFKKYKKENLQIKDVKITCNVVLGSPGKWATEVSIYLEQKK